VQALKMHGPVKGSLLALKRIGRCQPWGTSGYDPVPKILIKTMKFKNKNMSENKKPPYYDLLKTRMFPIVLLLLLLNACHTGKTKTENADSAKVLVSILPYKYFVEKIAGDYIEVMVLIPPGTTPHVYDPTPRQMAEISHVDIYLYNGNLTFEQTWIDKMTNNYPRLETHCLSYGIETIHVDDGADIDSEHLHHHQGIDPHTWLSLINGKIIAKNIFNILSQKYPQQTEELQRNFNNFIAEIDLLNAEIISKLNDIPSRKFMIFHPSLSYFARDYDLQQIPIEFEGKEPSPKQLRASIDLAKAEGLKVILIQKEFDTQNAQIIADEIGGRIVPIDPLSENWAQNLFVLAQQISSSTK